MEILSWSSAWWRPCDNFRFPLYSCFNDLKLSFQKICSWLVSEKGKRVFAGGRNMPLFGFWSSKKVWLGLGQATENGERKMNLFCLVQITFSSEINFLLVSPLIERATKRITGRVVFNGPRQRRTFFLKIGRDSNWIWTRNVTFDNSFTFDENVVAADFDDDRPFKIMVYVISTAGSKEHLSLVYTKSASWLLSGKYYRKRFLFCAWVTFVSSSWGRERERERDACDVDRYHTEIASDHAYDTSTAGRAYCPLIQTLVAGYGSRSKYHGPVPNSRALSRAGAGMSDETRCGTEQRVKNDNHPDSGLDEVSRLSAIQALGQIEGSIMNNSRIQILFSFSSNKDRRTDSRIRCKNFFRLIRLSVLSLSKLKEKRIWLGIIPTRAQVYEFQNFLRWLVCLLQRSKMSGVKHIFPQRPSVRSKWSCSVCFSLILMPFRGKRVSQNFKYRTESWLNIWPWKWRLPLHECSYLLFRTRRDRQLAKLPSPRLEEKSSAAINQKIYLHLRESMWLAKFRWKTNIGRRSRKENRSIFTCSQGCRPSGIHILPARTEVSFDNACAPFLRQRFEKNGDGRRSYERFEREERPKKNTKSRGYSFLQFEKKLSQGLWEPIFIV